MRVLLQVLESRPGPRVGRRELRRPRRRRWRHAVRARFNWRSAATMSLLDSPFVTFSLVHFGRNEWYAAAFPSLNS